MAESVSRVLCVCAEESAREVKRGRVVIRAFLLVDFARAPEGRVAAALSFRDLSSHVPLYLACLLVSAAW